MKYIIETDDINEAKIALQAPDLLFALQDMDNRLRARTKYSEDMDEADNAQYWRDELTTICAERNIRLWE